MRLHAEYVLPLRWSPETRRATNPDADAGVQPARAVEVLRGSGMYPRMRDKIRERDERLQGTTNPMVADHGASSAARQYSGRRVGPSWQAPFYPKRMAPLNIGQVHADQYD